MSTGQIVPGVERGKHGKQQRQAAFIDAATAVFAEKGYDAATTREVAERAGCSEGLIHRYFGGKRGLLLAILERKGASVAATMALSVPESDDLRRELQAMMTVMLQHMWDQRDFMRVASSRAIIDAEVGGVISTRINASRVAVVRERLVRHKDAGRVRADVDLEAVAQMISGLAFEAGFFLQCVFAVNREEVARIAAHSIAIIARGIESIAAGAYTSEAEA